jgi:hypothetical protein
MTRDQAIEQLARDDLRHLSSDQRGRLLLDWWTLDRADGGYAELPEVVRRELERGDEPGDPEDSRYDGLLLLALERSYAGTVNGYLEARLAGIGQAVRVEGPVEPRNECPCCGWLTLSRRGEYEICPVCFWEDDSQEDDARKADADEALDRLSSVNHLTLREARRNFLTIGAVDSSARAHVLADGRERYAPGPRAQLREPGW